jgi:hypothetical protein
MVPIYSASRIVFSSCRRFYDVAAQKAVKITKAVLQFAGLY